MDLHQKKEKSEEKNLNKREEGWKWKRRLRNGYKDERLRYEKVRKRKVKR